MMKTFYPTKLAHLILVLGLAILSPYALAQTLLPIYEKTPVALASTKTIAEFPRKTFLENIALAANGDLYVTSYLEGKVYKVTASGESSVWTAVDGTLAGIALNPDGSAVLSGWIKGKDAAVFFVSATGKAEVLTKLDGGMFPNGVLRLASGRFLVADSYKGAIWEVNVATRSASIWIADELLSRDSAKNPTPAVNGIKLFAGSVYASNTAKQLLVKIPLVEGKPGKPELLRKSLGIDDFDFGPDGTLYGATHVYNSLVSMKSDGSITVLAGLAQGLAGSTAVVAKQTITGVTLYVTTNGGMSIPPTGGVQTGKVLRVDIE
jgi:hypothetical protein